MTYAARWTGQQLSVDRTGVFAGAVFVLLSAVLVFCLFIVRS